jgi:proteic killer suppression protein
LQIEYKNKSIKKVCTDAHEATKQHGPQMADVIHLRIDQIEAADSVEFMIQHRIGRCHALQGNRKGEYAVDLVHPYRLVFTKKGEEIQIARIMEIVDYH